MLCTTNKFVLICTYKKAFGHESISVLNGGLPAWEKEEGPLETGTPQPVEPKVYKVPHVNKDIIRDYQTVLSNARNIQNGKDGAQVLDARPYARFTGEAPEPRVGLSSGHMPGSISVAFNEVVESGEMLNDDKLRKVFESKGVNFDKEIITSCGIV
jgi:thiosulfate/3-mercaptopyruvate sulfurtransferase